MANYLGEVKDVEDVKQKSSRKKLEKQTIREVKAYLKGENIKPAEWQNSQELIEIKQDTKEKIKTQNPEVLLLPDKSNSKPTFEHKYQRYEWA